MNTTTRAQREACWTLYQRHAERIAMETSPATGYHCKSTLERYRAFRKSFFNNGHWLGGFVGTVYHGIEPDGHTHT